ACGDVIRHDRRTPRLAIDFTDRLMASLPAHRAVLSSGQHRRTVVKRWVEFGGIPAIAACLVFMVMFNGRHKQDPRDMTAVLSSLEPNALVAGDSAIIVGEALDNLGQWNNFKPMAAQVFEDVHRDLQSRAESAPPQDSFVSELLRPMFSLVNPPIAPSAASDDVERF